MRSFSSLAIAAFVAVWALPSNTYAIDLTFTPFDDGNGLNFGFFTEADNWREPFGNPQLPSPSDNLFINVPSLTNIYTTDYTRVRSGSVFETNDVFLYGTSELRIGPDPNAEPADNLIGMKAANVDHTVWFAGISTNLEVTNRYTISTGNLNLQAGQSTFKEFYLSNDARAAILHGSSLTTESIVINDLTSTALSVLWNGSSLSTQFLTSNSSAGTIIDMVSPSAVPGGSSASISQLAFVTDYRGGTLFKVADGDDSDPLISKETKLSLAEVLVSIADSTTSVVYAADNGGEIEQTGTLEIQGPSDAVGVTTVAEVRNGATVKLDDIRISGDHSIGNVDGVGSALTAGGVLSTRDADALGVPLARVTNFGQISLQGLTSEGASSTVFSADNGTITTGATNLKFFEGTVADVVNGGNVNLGVVRIENSGFARFNSNGSTLTIGDQTGDNTTSPTTSRVFSSDVSIDARNGSTLNMYEGLYIATDASLTVKNSNWSGLATDGVNTFFRRSTFLAPGSIAVDVDTVNIDGLDLTLNGPTTGQIKNSTLRMSLSLQGEGSFTIDGSSGFIGNLQVNSTTGKTYNFQVTNGSSTHSSGLALGAFNGGQVNATFRNAYLTADNTGVGGNSTFDSTGTANLTLREGSFLGTSLLALGASKYYVNGAVQGPVFGGGGTLQLLDGSRLAVGSFAPGDPSVGSWVQANLPEFQAVVSVGPTSVLDVAGGSAYLGAANNASEQVFTPGTLTVGFNGVLNGTGTIVGNVVNDGGTIDLGFSPGTLIVDGVFTQASGDMIFELGAGTNFDRLLADSVNLNGGRLILRSWNGYGITGADRYSIFGTSPIDFTGFDFVNGIVDETGFGMQFDRLTGELFASNPVPEPATMLALGVGALALVRRRRTK